MLGPIFSLKELSITVIMQWHKSPFIHPGCLGLDDLPNRKQHDPQMLTLEDPTLVDTYPFLTQLGQILILRMHEGI